MPQSDSNPPGKQNQTQARINPDHPSWKLPPNQAYVATREEVAALRKKAATKATKTQEAVATTARFTAMGAGTSASGTSLTNVVKQKSPQEIRMEAAAAVTAAYKRHGSGFRIRVQRPEQWESEAKALSAREGCDFMEAMYRVGFVHSAVSFPPVGGRG